MHSEAAEEPNCLYNWIASGSLYICGGCNRRNILTKVFSKHYHIVKVQPIYTVSEQNVSAQ